MQKGYGEKQLQAAYLRLSSEQQRVLDTVIKRGMKTKWLNIWAKKKGEVLTTDQLENPEESMNSLLEWILLDYEDHLRVNPAIKCECGRALRYRYTVLHKETGQIYRLGRVHFEQHTGLSSEMVRLITKGIKEIDLEREEILTKVIDHWVMPCTISQEIVIPKDIEEQLEVGLPLLDRQVARIRKLMNSNERKLSRGKMIKVYHNQQKLPEIKRLNDEPDITLNPDILYKELIKARITAPEAKALFTYLSRNTRDLEKYGIHMKDIKAATLQALGRISNPAIREWLVEIYDL